MEKIQSATIMHSDLHDFIYIIYYINLRWQQHSF